MNKKITRMDAYVIKDEKHKKLKGVNVAMKMVKILYANVKEEKILSMQIHKNQIFGHFKMIKYINLKCALKK